MVHHYSWCVLDVWTADMIHVTLRHAVVMLDLRRQGTHRVGRLGW